MLPHVLAPSNTTYLKIEIIGWFIISIGIPIIITLLAIIIYKATMIYKEARYRGDRINEIYEIIKCKENTKALNDIKKNSTHCTKS